MKNLGEDTPENRPAWRQWTSKASPKQKLGTRGPEPAGEVVLQSPFASVIGSFPLVLVTTEKSQLNLSALGLDPPVARLWGRRFGSDGGADNE